jgi:hypothetical protein
LTADNLIYRPEESKKKIRFQNPGVRRSTSEHYYWGLSPAFWLLTPDYCPLLTNPPVSVIVCGSKKSLFSGERRAISCVSVSVNCAADGSGNRRT